MTIKTIQLDISEQKQKYPIGTQDFSIVRTEGYLYVDKTDLIYRLVNGSSRHVFLARPRRFGKSLLLSTIRYYLEGRKDLFDGLKIIHLEENWINHPVLYLSFASFNSANENSLESILDYQFSIWEEQYAVKNNRFDYAQRFQNIIRSAYNQSGRRVGVLIDEYDLALINTISNTSLHNKNREVLKSVYSNLKDMDAFIKFGMLTGVSRFSNTSIFSGLNNITDISFDDDYAAICGFTTDEIKNYLHPGVKILATNHNKEVESIFQELKDEYDGYHFSEALIDIYNPYSLLNCLDKRKIDNYWIMSGATTYLVNKIEESQESLAKIFSSYETPQTLTTIDAAFDSPVSLMYQTGYLTIKKYDSEERAFLLGIPNREVDQSLFRLLLGHYNSGSNPSDNSRLLKEMSLSLSAGNPDEFLNRLKSFLASID